MTYSVLRLGLFGACLAVLYWAGLGGWLLVVVAAFAAWGVSYVVLAGLRDAAAVVLAQRAVRRADGRRFSEAVEADAAHEDAVVDAAEQAAGGGSEGQAEAQQHPVPELDQSGAGKHRNQRDPACAEQDGHAQQGDRQGQ